LNKTLLKSKGGKCGQGYTIYPLQMRMVLFVYLSKCNKTPTSTCYTKFLNYQHEYLICKCYCISL